jgi:hypothetical protein
MSFAFGATTAQGRSAQTSRRAAEDGADLGGLLSRQRRRGVDQLLDHGAARVNEVRVLAQPGLTLIEQEHPARLVELVAGRPSPTRRGMALRATPNFSTNGVVVMRFSRVVVVGTAGLRTVAFGFSPGYGRHAGFAIPTAHPAGSFPFQARWLE